jgi:SWI/SNF-related matrix-associated actin-dependent regulator 1 of chromatin subfamily A
MVNLDEIKSRAILNKLRDYQGNNPYISYLRNQITTTKINLTQTQIAYIDKNYDVEPIELNNVVEITPFLAEELQKKYELSISISKVLIEYYLGETENAFHVLGKFFKNQKESKTFWLPKTQVNEDIFYKKSNIQIDFEKYIKLDKAKRIPYEYQKEGPKFLLERKKCVLADDQGLGKTYQSIIAALESGCERILIICPAFLKINWKREILNFIDDENEISIIDGSNWDPKKFTIINYDILKKFHTIVDGRKKYKDGDISREIVDFKFDCIIVDEAQNLKNTSSTKTKIVMDIKKHTDFSYIWLLTGTPISNRPMNYYNLLKMLNHPITENWQYYVKRYCKGFQMKLKNSKKKFWITTGASNLDELNLRTKNIVIRRLKSDHLNLPEKIRTPIFLQLKNRKEYDKVYDQYIEWRIKQGKSTNVSRQLIELTLLRKFLAIEKTTHTIELAQEMIDQDKKVIIFTNYAEELEILKEAFKGQCVVTDGTTSMKLRQKNVDDFQTKDKIKVFIGQVLAAGVGITLTKAEVVIFNSLDWVPGNLDQAEDRAYRIGQLKNVNVYYMLFDETIELIVWNTIQRKKAIIDKVMGEEKEDEDFNKMLEEIGQEG